MLRTFVCLAALLVPTLAAAQPTQGNRLAYLDEVDPYYPSHKFPKLTAPMWVGEPGVEAVVILGIDDMKEPKRYEAYLRPILRRLTEIDGRAPVSIMTCAIDPKDPQLQTWLKEGLSLECHTFDHPCPFFKGGFDKAKGTYDKCVDLLHAVPNSKPVAFRVPCCDSMNTPSPRFYAEIFNKTTAKGNFLQIDTSVFNVFTSADPELPKKLVLDDQGNERFTPYLPKDRSFVNWVTNYPYPYVIGRLCWQFPCMTPSDWQAQHRHKPNNPKTVEDWKAALDCTVIKQGVFCMVFHPHGWIRNDQVVEFIDYAVEKHGRKVKFLTFKEALERLEKNLLDEIPTRAFAETGSVADLDGDGSMDVLIGGKRRTTKLWSPRKQRWSRTELPERRASEFGSQTRVGILQDGRPALVHRAASPPMGIDRIYQSTWHFTGQRWRRDDKASPTIMVMKQEEYFVDFLLRDLDGDGRCEMISPTGAVFVFHPERGFIATPFMLPCRWTHPLSPLATADAGLRLVDLNGDGKLDLVLSNEKEYGVYLFENMEKGWSRKVLAGKAGDKDALPPIARNGTNNGFWVHSGQLWWANEDTMLLKDHVDRRSIKELLKMSK